GRRVGDAAAGTRRGSGASCRLRRQSFRCEEPRRLDAQDRIPTRHSAQRRRGRDRPGGRRRFAVAGGRARLGLERPMATPLRDQREDVGERVMAVTGKRGVDAVIEMDLAANARPLPDVLAPNGVVAIYGSGAPAASIPFQFLLQNSITMKFFLV